jgi:hypothetical protein
MNRVLFLILFLLSLQANAQFRSLNPMSFLPCENPSFVVSPMDYNKAGAYYQSSGGRGIQGQMNLDKIYSAVGVDVYQNSNAFNAAALQFATHSYTTRSNLHVGFGARAEFSNYDNQRFAYALGLNVMSNPAGRFLAGVSYKNEDLQVTPFENEVTVLSNVMSAQVGIAVARLSRKSNLGFSGIYKRGFQGEEKIHQFQSGLNFSNRKYMVGFGVRAWDNAHMGALVRGYYLYRKFVIGYTALANDQHRSLQQWNHEISLQYKF